MRAPALVIALGLAVTGCTQFPELDATATPGVADAPYPDLLPLGLLLGDAPMRATPDMSANVVSRAEALRARAARLQGPVIDAGTRRRMARGVASR
ncbi:hypothetical protein FIU97_07465 [Roseivivax sp. THAF40]|uniref:hypothetical protein n=1 Tax=unclassified Roseivivax TaxID=2639302 RepID=UPI001269008E|nr:MULTISPECIES: hypothetical protein [unclassified Roseivivax]QFS82641.1 hypothetical protein FIV09_07360 [Roseivivax sp. THAF197b]QFT46410.1 hypothetical protein FIU97_07465 [Roseivivax sp. THAF40]